MKRGANRYTQNYTKQVPNQVSHLLLNTQFILFVSQLAIRCGHHQLAKMITSFLDDDVGELCSLYYCYTLLIFLNTEFSTQQPVYNPMARTSRVTVSSPQKPPEVSAATLPRRPHDISTTTDIPVSTTVFY